MLEQGRPQRTRTNMALWVSVAILSIIGLGANVYKANTGDELDWASTIAEVACLLTAGLFIFDKFRKKHKEQEEENK
jgi:predicted metal-binding membrane protein